MGKAIIISDLTFAPNLGKVTITDNGETPVAPIAITGLNIVSKPSTVTDSVQLSVTYIPADTTQKGISWSSSDTNTAVVSSTGLVTVKKTGAVTITATSVADSSVNDNFTATCTVTITHVPVTGITVSGSTSGEAGSTIQLSATVTPTNASNKMVIWNSSNTDVATVNSTGLVTLLAAGTVTINAKSEGETTVQGTHTITVTASTVPDNYPTNGLVVRLDATGMSNPATVTNNEFVWPDLSGNGNDFTIKNFSGTAENGWGNDELVFAENLQQHCVNSSLIDGGLGNGVDGEVTVFIKAKTKRNHGTMTRLLRASVNGSDISNYSLIFNAGKFAAIVGREQAHTLPVSLQLEEYYVFGLRISNDAIRLYLNSQTFDATLAPIRLNSTGHTALGANLNQWNGHNEHFYGAFKEVLIYDRALADSEVAMVIDKMK